MKTDALASILKQRIVAAGGRSDATAHLLGIEFADQLEGRNPRELCALAGFSANYWTEVSKGRKPAPFVRLKS